MLWHFDILSQIRGYELWGQDMEEVRSQKINRRIMFAPVVKGQFKNKTKRSPPYSLGPEEAGYPRCNLNEKGHSLS